MSAEGGVGVTAENDDTARAINAQSYDPRTEFDYTFDPSQDWPPHGAQVVAVGFTATFDCESDAPVGWHLDDGRYARPFDSLGRLLAQRWAANPQMENRP